MRRMNPLPVPICSADTSKVNCCAADSRFPAMRTRERTWSIGGQGQP
jgi:hypothetical protein